MNNPHDVLSQMGITLPAPPKPLAAYVPSVRASATLDTLFISGQLPLEQGELIAKGIVPDQVDNDTAIACAKQCAINALAVAQGALGSLDRISHVLKLSGFVAATPEFTDHPKIINGASLFIGELFGEAGTHARAAVGVSSLPLGAPVEIEFTFAIKPDLSS